MNLAEDEKNKPIVFRRGIPYIVIGDGKSRISRIAPDRNWVVPIGLKEQKVEHFIPR